MKLMVMLLTVCCFQLQAKSYAQRVTLDRKNVTIDKIFKQIYEQTGYQYVCSRATLQKANRVSIHVQDAPLKDVLEQLFANQPLTYTLTGKAIIVKIKPAGRHQTFFDDTEPLDEAFVRITGKVTDASTGQPLSGVSVQVKGTTMGTSTDNEGNFSIEVTTDNVVLVFSSVGYESKEEAVNGRTHINTSLSSTTTGLNEVVVVGYGTQKKSDLTGSVSVISSDEFKDQPIVRMEDAIKGRVAGVVVNTPNGAPGGDFKIRIRGANSINGGNTPLYVVDGFIGGDLKTINPNDIASIDILKDASATAVYGSRGANGVVIITTKKGRANSYKVDVNSFYSFQKISKKMKLMNGAEFMEMTNARDVANGATPAFDAADLANPEYIKGTDWQDALLQSGATQNHELALSGGNNKTVYRLSGNIVDQKGIIMNSWYKRYNLSANINSDISKKFHVDFNSYGTYENYRNNYTYIGRNQPFGQALVFPPNLPVYIDGKLSTTQGLIYGPVAGNPIYSAKNNIFDNRVFTIQTFGQLRYDLSDHLELSVAGGLKGNYNMTPTFKLAGPTVPLSTSQGEYGNSNTFAFQNTNKVTYSNTFNDIHHLQVDAIFEHSSDYGYSTYSIVSSFPTVALGYNNLGLGKPVSVSSGYSGSVLQSYVGRVNYQLKDKYLLTATFRADGSSKFQKQNRYGYFPSFALGWKMSKEPFIQRLGFFQDLKLRTSYGSTGNQAIGPYQTLSLLLVGQDYLWDGLSRTPGVGPGTPGNTNLKWETTKQLDIGLDFSIFDNKLQGTFDYYNKKTSDLLLSVPLPGYNGGGSIMSNVGSVENYGFEAALDYLIVDHADWSIRTSVNWSTNKNKILSLGADDQILTTAGYTGLGNSNPVFILKTGESLGTLRGFQYDGLWQSDESAAAAVYGHVPGDPRYIDQPVDKDTPGDGQINGDDMVIIGNTNPKFIYGWNTNISVKNFDLNIFFTGVQGNDVLNLTRYLVTSTSADVQYPTSKEILNHWTPTNTNTDIPGFSPTSSSQGQSTQFLEKGSYLRLSNLTLGYNFPVTGAKRSFYKDARIYASAQNLFTFTKYKGVDPELSGVGNTDIGGGIDYGTYPAFRTYTVGVKLGF